MRIAIVKLSALGDIVHAMVVLQYIKKFDQDISIDWIIEKKYQGLLKHNSMINKVHNIRINEAKQSKSLGIILSDLKKISKLQRYDLVIDLQGLIKSAIISRIIPSKLTIGFDKFSVRESFSSIFYSKTFNISYSENVVKRNFELIKFALDLPYQFEDLKEKSPLMTFSNDYHDSCLSKEKKNILIISGASHQSKIYPSKNFSKITQILEGNFIVVWGNEFEKNLANEIKAISKKVKISEHLSIEALAYLISQVDLVIGGDTGPTHLAWALNIPSITLFGPTPGHRNTVPSGKHIIIESISYVNPLKIDKSDQSIREIKVEVIVKAARKLLKN